MIQKLKMSVHKEYYEDKSQNIKYEYYFNENHQLHNENDKPAFIYYYPDGSLKEVKYFKENELHREGDKPAWIKYYPSGNIESEKYMHNHFLHREGDKPAWIKYYPSGNIQFEEYRILHRFYKREENRPNIIEYSKDGNIITEIWMDEDEKTELKRNVIDFNLEFTKACSD